MKILHVNTEHTWRGGEQQTLFLMVGLQNKGHISHLICWPNSSIFQRAREKEITVFPIRMKGEADLVAAIKMARIIKRGSYDIVHSHTSHAHSLVTLACFFIRHKPIRVLTRRVDFSIFRHNFLGMNLYKYTKGVDHIVAISQKVKDVLMKDGISSHQISIAHSGVDVDRFRGMKGDYLFREFSILPETPVLGNVAYLVGHKGQKYLIRAMSRVTQRYPDVRLFILGEGTLEGELKALVAELGLEKNVIFTGFRKDVGAFFDIFDVMVMSSVEEGLGSTILDGLSLEVPIVATDAGGIPEIISDGETGTLVPRANPDALAAGIIQMLSNPAQAKKMARRGRQKVLEHFSDKAMVKANICIYQKLIGRRDNPGAYSH